MIAEIAAPGNREGRVRKEGEKPLRAPDTLQRGEGRGAKISTVPRFPCRGDAEPICFPLLARQGKAGARLPSAAFHLF